MKIRFILVAIFSTMFSTSVFAAYFGSKTVYTFTDASGNTYNVNKFGNTTLMNETNYRTGNTWSKTSQRIGNSTFTNGTAGNVNSWNSTTTSSGNFGTDSDGNSFFAPRY